MKGEFSSPRTDISEHIVINFWEEERLPCPILREKKTQSFTTSLCLPQLWGVSSGPSDWVAEPTSLRSARRSHPSLGTWHLRNLSASVESSDLAFFYKTRKKSLFSMVNYCFLFLRVNYFHGEIITFRKIQKIFRNLLQKPRSYHKSIMKLWTNIYWTPLWLLKHGVGCFAYIILFSLHNNLMKWELLLPLQRWVN